MKKILLLFSLLPTLLQVSAQAGKLDSSFGTNGFYRTGNQFNKRVLQSDGKLIGLQIFPYGFSLTRYSTNGTVDVTFGSGGTVTVLIPGMGNNTGGAIEIQKNNNSIVVIVNGRNYTKDSTIVAITKFSSTGSMDATFGDNGMRIEKFYYASTGPGGIDPVNPAGIRVFAVKDDGTIVALAQYSGYRNSYFSINYYSSDGNKSWITNTVKYPYAYYTTPKAIAISDDGKVEAGGSVDGPGPASLLIFAGNSDFDYSNYPFYADLGGMALQNDGKLVVIESSQHRLLRFNPNGALDVTFGTSGAVTLPFFGSSIRLQPDGKIIVGGYPIIVSGYHDFALARYNPNGILDSSFGSGGITGTDFGRRTTILDMLVVNNKLYVMGEDTSGNGIVAAYLLASNTTTCKPPTFKNDGTIVLDASCGNNDGQISIIPTSGTAPFMYSKDGGVTYVAGPNSGSGFMGLSAGVYKLRLKDANGCESAIVEREVKLNCATTCTTPTFKNDGTVVLDASCGNNDGQISIIPTSGTAPFVYSIDGGATYKAGANTGAGFTNLAPGTYRLRLKDANGCESAIVERTIRAIYGGPTFTYKISEATCGNKNGSITIVPTSGTGSFMYSIDAGNTYEQGPSTGYTFTNLAANTYYLRVKSAAGCESAIIYEAVKANFSNCTGSFVQANITTLQMDISPEVINTEAIKAHPNPTKGQFKLQLKGFTSSVSEISIFNAEGKMVQKRQWNMAGTNTVDFDLTGKAKGMYYIKITSNSGTRTLKVLMQ